MDDKKVLEIVVYLDTNEELLGVARISDVTLIYDSGESISNNKFDAGEEYNVCDNNDSIINEVASRYEVDREIVRIEGPDTEMN